MRFLLILFLMTLAAGPGMARAGTDDAFLKVNSLYVVRAPRGTPLPGKGDVGDNPSGATVRIIQAGMGQWYWVEFDVAHFPTPGGKSTGPVMINKGRAWLNFAHVVYVYPLDGEIDYKLTYPQGFTIVPYSGP